MKYLLDTDTCIYIIKHKPAQVLEKFLSLEVGSVSVSAVTVAELLYGAEKSQYPQQNRDALGKFLMPLNILDFNLAAAESYGKIRAAIFDSRSDPFF